MERRRFYPVSSGIAFALAFTGISSFIKAPPNDGPCGVETLIYQAEQAAERDGIGGTLPHGCLPQEIQTARDTFVLRRDERQRRQYFPRHEIISREESVFVNSKREAETNQVASIRPPQ